VRIVTTSTRPPTWAFLAWAAVGIVVCVGVLTPFTIGVPVAAAGALAAGALLLRPSGRNYSAVGLSLGAGVLALYIGYLNRGGPGEVCTGTVQARQCTDEWSPWPWLVVGMLFITAGTATFVWLRRHTTRRSGSRRSGGR
jgi:hypothetical protein